MLNNIFYSILFSLFFISLSGAQNDEKPDDVDLDITVVNDSIQRTPLNVLAPSKAAFYSTILPGLGQAYNKKYWKIPLVYAAIGIPAYLFITNDKEYDRYRNAYKRRLAGFDDSQTEFANISDDGLIRAQQTLRRNKELALLITIGMYALNIVDANVDAHLLQFNVDENLSMRPHFKYNQMENNTDLGLTLNFKF